MGERGVGDIEKHMRYDRYIWREGCSVRYQTSRDVKGLKGVV